MDHPLLSVSTNPIIPNVKHTCAKCGKTIFVKNDMVRHNLEYETTQILNVRNAEKYSLSVSYNVPHCE